MSILNNRKRILNRGCISLAVCFLLIITALSATTTSFETVASTENRLSYSFLFIEPNFQTIEADNSLYTNLNMPGCMVMGRQAGEPSLPVKFIKLLLPPMKTVADVTVIGNPIEIDFVANLVSQIGDRWLITTYKTSHTWKVTSCLTARYKPGCLEATRHCSFHSLPTVASFHNIDEDKHNGM